MTRDKQSKKGTTKQTQQLSCTCHDRTINNSTKTEQKVKSWFIKNEHKWTPPPPLLPIHTHKHSKPSYCAIISSKNKTIMISSAQMSQPNGCESLGKDNIQLTLGIWYKPMCNYPLPPARHQPHPLSPSTQAINQE